MRISMRYLPGKYKNLSIKIGKKGKQLARGSEPLKLANLHVESCLFNLYKNCVQQHFVVLHEDDR